MVGEGDVVDCAVGVVGGVVGGEGTEDAVG